MNKIYIIVFLFLFGVCCQKHQTPIDFKKELTGKTFELTNSGIQQDIEFLDSTTTTYSLYVIESPYSLEFINDTVNRLYFNDEPTLIYKGNSKQYEFKIIGERLKDTLLLKEVTPKTDPEMIQGTWIDEKKRTYKISDSYISVYFNDSLISDSRFRFDSSNRYISFNLPIKLNRIERLWRIKNMKKDSLVIDRFYKTKDGWTVIDNDNLLKKR